MSAAPPDVTGWRMVWALLVALAMLCPPHTASQHLPTRDETHFHFQINHAEIFYDTKLLPDGAEAITYIFNNTERRFFFLVEEENTPLSITVTPCGSLVDWSLEVHDIPQEFSGAYSDADQQDEEDELLRHANRIAAEAAVARPLVMRRYSGQRAATFLTDAGPAGVYTLIVRAREDDTSVRIYATTTPYSDHPYPELPLDPDVHVLSVNEGGVTLRWKPSPTDAAHGFDVQYCLMANRKRNFESLCGAEAFMHGETPPTAPPHAGFGFAWEQEHTRAFRSQLHPQTSRRPQDVTFLCIGKKTTYTFHNLKQGERYFFDVFVVNPRNNRSSTYNGSSAVTKKNMKTFPAKRGKLVVVHIKKYSGHKLFKYEHTKSTKELIISVLPCQSEMNIKVSRRGKVVARGVVSDLENFTIRRAKKGVYLIDVTVVQYRSASLQLFIGTRSKDLPYPELPEDRRIKVFQNKRSCDTVTVAWLATRRKVQYCLYAIKPAAAISQFLPRTLFAEGNKCVGPGSRKRGEKIMCKAVRYKNKRRAVMTEVVSRLQHHTRYTFEVYATLPGSNGQTLSYKPTSIVTSGSKC